MPNCRSICLFLASIYRTRWHHFFQTAILSISRHRTEKITFFGILRSNWFKNTHFSFKRKTIKNLSLCDPGLTRLCHWLAWSHIEKWPRFLKSTYKSDYKSSTSYPKKNFWIWWPFVTFHGLTLALTRIYYGTCAQMVCFLSLLDYFGRVLSKNYRCCALVLAIQKC